MIKIKLYNYELEPFIEFLYKLNLVDQKSRMRTRFIKLLAEKLQLFREEHLQLLREHCNLDEEGNPKILVRDGQQQYDVIDQSVFGPAFRELASEEVVIEQNEERKKMLLSVQDSVLNCGLVFEGQSQFEYDRWCEIVEQVDYGNQG